MGFLCVSTCGKSADDFFTVGSWRLAQGIHFWLRIEWWNFLNLPWKKSSTFLSRHMEKFGVGCTNLSVSLMVKFASNWSSIKLVLSACAGLLKETIPPTLLSMISWSRFFRFKINSGYSPVIPLEIRYIIKVLAFRVGRWKRGQWRVQLSCPRIPGSKDKRYY